MTIDLGQGRHITINTHGDKVWITVANNGGGTTVALDSEDGERAGLRLFRLARKIGRAG